MKKNVKPPALTRRLLNRLWLYEEKHSICGDLEETFSRMVSRKGSFYAAWWYRFQAIKSLPSYLRLTFFMVIVMFKNYFLISWRNIKKNKVYTLINLTGFAVGIASCLIILIHIKYELSFDRFHDNADRIYRVVLERTSPDRTRNWGWNTPRVSEAMVSDYPEVIRRVRILTETGRTQLKSNSLGMLEKKVLYTDPEFFDIFSIPIIKGDVLTFFQEPDSIVLTREMAHKYFGSEDPIGKVLTVSNWWEENKPHVVTGILDDLPTNSHIHYDFLIPLGATEVIEHDWGAWYSFNYVMLREGADWKALEAKLPGMVDRYLPTIFEGGEEEYREYLSEGHGFRYFLQPLRDIHLKSGIEHELEPVGNIIYVYLFAVIAGFIMVLACVNFINLSTSRSVSRAREVGVRKVLGSFRRQLMNQFLFESVLLTLMAMVLAIGLTLFLLPAFSDLTGADLNLVSFHPVLVVPGLLAFAILIGIFSGGYPAFFLSSFQPVSVLKSAPRTKASKIFLRNSLVVFQFTVSIALIIGTLLVKTQVDFMLAKDLGYDKANLLVIENTRALGKAIEAFKTELKNDPDVLATGGGGFPGVATHTFSVRARGVPSAPSVSLYNIGGDYEYLDTLGIPVVAGRKYGKGDIIDPEHRTIMLNESAAKALGLDNPVGRELDRGDQGIPIIGIIKDFHFRSLHSDIAPFAFIHVDNDQSIASCVAVRIRPGSLAAVRPRVEEVWKRFSGGLVFQYSILDERLANWYVSESRAGIISGVFSTLAVFIGCLGLFGLAAFTTEQRTREVGIRKVLGASIPNITFFFIKDFLKLVGIAFIIAVPIAYVVMNRWLQNYAYSINPGILPFVLAGVMTMVIAVFTVGFQVVRAALADPVDSLRYE
ncbi:ABC transporter permease [Acidobacteriota bacterium]